MVRYGHTALYLILFKFPLLCDAHLNTVCCLQLRQHILQCSFWCNVAQFLLHSCPNWFLTSLKLEANSYKAYVEAYCWIITVPFLDRLQFDSSINPVVIDLSQAFLMEANFIPCLELSASVFFSSLHGTARVSLACLNKAPHVFVAFLIFSEDGSEIA